MGINRRAFLAITAGLFISEPIYCRTLDRDSRFLTCERDRSGQYYANLSNTTGETIYRWLLPARGHGISVDCNTGIAAIFSRRPGSYVWVVDLNSGEVLWKIDAPAGYHFYGHGMFTPDGEYLLCTENHFESGKGVIGVYQTNQKYQRISEIQTQGIGPHEIKLLNDQTTIVVANGGILTHPDLPRIKLNLDEMRPNLSYLDFNSGRLIEKVEPPGNLHQLSIRHIDVADDNTVAIAMQYQGRSDQLPPLIALHRRNSELQLLRAPEKIQQRLRNYCGSIVFSRDCQSFAVSSPRGGLVTYWSIQGDYLGYHEQSDACGVGQSGNGFMVSDGTGGLTQIDKTLTLSDTIKPTERSWDNHLIVINT
ncbi:MAG: DUF1513 domain-containing protein [Candidatus Thiodiazotropha sp. DIVDIV]